jgi:WD40 repeat protein
MAWSPDGRTLASGSCDETARLWRTDGTLVRTIKPHAGTVMAVAWSPNGKVLATGSVQSPTKNTVNLWDPTSGVRLGTLHTKYSGGKFYNLGWSADGRFLVGGATDYSEWRADASRVFEHPGCDHCTPAWGFGWAPDSTMWGVGNESGDVFVYGTDGSLITRTSNPYGNVDVMAWSPDGRVLAGGNILWRLEAGEAVTQGSLGAGRVSALAWSPSSAVIAATFVGDAAVTLRGEGGQLLASAIGHQHEVLSLAWSPDGRILATGSADRTVRLWDLGGWVGKVPPL